MNPIQTLDTALLSSIQNHLAYPAIDPVMIGLTWLGNGGFIWALLGICLCFFRKTRHFGIAVITALVVGGLCGNAIKLLIARERPFTAEDALVTASTLKIALPGGYSFPSGHTLTSFAAASALCCRFHKAGAAALVLAALIAFSRLYLYVHYPSDVLAGAILGILVGVGTARVLRHMLD